MKNALFFVIVSFCAGAFASADKADVDQYIARLRSVLPEFPAACFVNVCDNQLEIMERFVLPKINTFL